ncbi:MAG TPA: ABC transporter permease [Candidatus Chromulinivoraceae bacterium]|nr:ABC transporter permease [Candidatus Chromulinivoraceae bacterium]
MHNLGTVVRFEIARTLKKRSFWMAALAMPVILGVIGAVVYFSNKASDTQSKSLADEHYTVGVTDNSHLIAPGFLKSIGAVSFTTQTQGEQAVKSGAIDAYFYYPANVNKETVQIYGKEVGIFDDSRYQSLATLLLTQSVAAKADPSLVAILQNHVNYNATTYTNGQQDKGFLKLIAPGLFLVLFYFMIATFGNQILTSITEEKENRVIEMILATIKPTTLLVGKLLSLIVLALIQMVVILVPVIAGYFTFKNQLALPSFDLSTIPLDPLAITLGAVIFIVSYLMYTGILMTLGAAMPTAKEAGGFFGAVMALTFGPLYAAPLFVTAPDSLIVQILSYFPLTAPIPLLLRNAVGNLQLVPALISIAILIATTILAISIGVRIFRFGALEYSRKLSVREIFGRKA